MRGMTTTREALETPLVIKIKRDRLRLRYSFWYVEGFLTGSDRLHCRYLRWQAARKHSRQN